MDSTEIAAKLRERRAAHEEKASVFRTTASAATQNALDEMRLAEECEWMLEQLDAPSPHAMNDPRMDPAPKARRGDVQAEVLRFLKDNGAHQVNEIAAALERKKSQIAAVLRALMRDRKITAAGDEFYEIARALPLGDAAE